MKMVLLSQWLHTDCSYCGRNTVTKRSRKGMKRLTKVVLCDSGISERLMPSVRTVDAGCGVMDENGHGTAIAEILLRYGTDMEITSVRILDKHCECRLEKLFDVLEKHCDDADLVCLPLALNTCSGLPQLHELIRKLAMQGTIIVAALFNRKTCSLPAAYPEVIGCAADMEMSVNNTGFYSSERAIQAVIPAEPVVCAYMTDAYTVLGGNSLVCGLMTAHITRIFAEHGKLSKQETEKILCCQSIQDVIGTAAEQGSLLESEDASVRKRVCGLMTRFGLCENGENLMAQFTSKTEIFRFIQELHNAFRCINRKTMLRISDLASVDSICRYMMLQEL